MNRQAFAASDLKRDWFQSMDLNVFKFQQIMPPSSGTLFFRPNLVNKHRQSRLSYVRTRMQDCLKEEKIHVRENREK